MYSQHIITTIIIHKYVYNMYNNRFQSRIHHSTEPIYFDYAKFITRIYRNHNNYNYAIRWIYQLYNLKKKMIIINHSMKNDDIIIYWIYNIALRVGTYIFVTVDIIRSVINNFDIRPSEKQYTKNYEPFLLWFQVSNFVLI